MNVSQATVLWEEFNTLFTATIGSVENRRYFANDDYVALRAAFYKLDTVVRLQGLPAIGTHLPKHNIGDPVSMIGLIQNTPRDKPIPPKWPESQISEESFTAPMPKRPT